MKPLSSSIAGTKIILGREVKVLVPQGRYHAIERMLERNVSLENVQTGLKGTRYLDSLHTETYSYFIRESGRLIQVAVNQADGVVRSVIDKGVRGKINPGRFSR